MSYSDDKNPYSYSESSYAPVVANADEWERAAFIRRTYLHLALAIGAFAGILGLAFTVGREVIEPLAISMFGGYNFLICLVAFMVVSWVANSWAVKASSPGLAYAGLGLYVLAEAVIFIPLIYVADLRAPGSIASAAILTGVIFGGLTLVTFVTKKDFSFLRMYLALGMFAAFGFIIASLFFALPITSVMFATFMIVLMSGYILYYTSNVMLHYHTRQHVAASLALFACVATLFWYVIILFMGRD